MDNTAVEVTETIVGLCQFLQGVKRILNKIFLFEILLKTHFGATYLH